MSESGESGFEEVEDPQPEIFREYLDEREPLGREFEYVVWLWVDDGIYFGFWFEPRPEPDVVIVEEVVNLVSSDGSDSSDSESESMEEGGSSSDDEFIPEGQSLDSSSDSSVSL